MNLTSYQIPGLVLTEHEFRVPLDHGRPQGEQITIFAREVRATAKRDAALPWLVFFQGGPGFGAPRPAENSGWLKRALQDYRVLLLDQRGTGRSTPVTFQTLARLPSPQAQADYLKHFRADAIVADAELIRQALAGPDTPWTVLGQSYGGFCVLTYLSHAPQGLAGALITGGLLLFDTSVSYLRVSWLVLAVAGVVGFLFFSLVVGKVARSARRPHATGLESMVGAIGVALSPLTPEGQVRLHGETWKARTEEGDLLKDEPVEVLRTEGLTLVVKRHRRPDTDTQGDPA